MCLYSMLPAICANLLGIRANTACTIRMSESDAETSGRPSLKYASLEQAAPKRSLKVLKPGLSMLDRPRSNASAPCCFSSWIAFQNNIGIAPSLLKAESEQPYL